MIRSMTGCAVATAEVGTTQYAVELRSVNGRHFKVSLRVADELLALEGELEAALAKRINRGSVTLSARFSRTNASGASAVNGPALQEYVRQLRAALGPAADRVDPAHLLNLPGVLAANSTHEVCEAARGVLVPLVDEAAQRLLAMRATEGAALAADLRQHAAHLAAALERIAERAPLVVNAYRDRLRVRVSAMLAELGASVQDADLVREVSIFAERSDIAEEISRLRGHLEQFSGLLDPARVDPVGRTIDFLAQEMLREANTIASKSADSEISRAVVEVKTAIDRIKEQAQNAE